LARKSLVKSSIKPDCSTVVIVLPHQNQMFFFAFGKYFAQPRWWGAI